VEHQFKSSATAAELYIVSRQSGDFAEISQTGPEVHSRFFVTAFFRMTQGKENQIWPVILSAAKDLLGYQV
jgi:hypothetical protein